MPGFANLAAPIHKVTNLTRANRHLFKWPLAQSAAFHALKQQIITAPLFLRFPIDGFPFQLFTDASGIATDGMLYQNINGVRHNLFYHSKVLSPVEQRYSVPEKEALAIFHCLQRMRALILGRTVYIHTDHCPICGMLQKAVNNRRIERVANLIQEYQIAQMKHVSGKDNCLADYLSRPFDNPLFDIDYGVESKVSASPSDVPVCSSFSTPLISIMTLRPRRKPTVPSVSSTDVLDSDHSIDVSSDSSSSNARAVSYGTITASPNVFDVGQLQQAQAKDPEIHCILTELGIASRSTSCSDRSFIIKYGILHKLLPLSFNSVRNTAVPYLPQSMVKSLLVAVHDDPYQGGHFSTDKMFSKIRSRYWWPRMRQSIQSYINACVLCQQYNYTRQKKSGHLHSRSFAAAPFHIIGMDFCGPFLESPSGNRYILVITDLFSRFVTAVPLTHNTAELTALTLFRHIFCRFGVCSTLITDQGSHFANHLMRAFKHLLGYHYILTTPYHPQSNGVIERFNASMVVQLSKLQHKHHNNWDDYLDAVVFAYNTSAHKSTGLSPFQLVFGRSPRLPIDSLPSSFCFPRPNDYFGLLQRTLREFHQFAKANISIHQQYQKQRYDRHRSDPHYSVNDRVFARIFTPRTKLVPRFSIEPSIIIDTTHPTYLVRHLSTGLERRYHVSDLRPVTVAYDDDSCT